MQQSCTFKNTCHRYFDHSLPFSLLKSVYQLLLWAQTSPSASHFSYQVEVGKENCGWPVSDVIFLLGFGRQWGPTWHAQLLAWPSIFCLLPFTWCSFLLATCLPSWLRNGWQRRGASWDHSGRLAFITESQNLLLDEASNDQVVRPLEFWPVRHGQVYLSSAGLRNIYLVLIMVNTSVEGLVSH